MWWGGEFSSGRGVAVYLLVYISLLFESEFSAGVYEEVYKYV